MPCDKWGAKVLAYPLLGDVTKAVACGDRRLRREVRVTRKHGMQVLLRPVMKCWARRPVVIQGKVFVLSPKQN